jgi:hypothetical protein
MLSPGLLRPGSGAKCCMQCHLERDRLPDSVGRIDKDPDSLLDDLAGYIIRSCRRNLFEVSLPSSRSGEPVNLTPGFVRRVGEMVQDDLPSPRRGPRTIRG